MPDFCPAMRARRPLGRFTRIGDDEKSKSGPFTLGQFVLSGSRQAETYASSFVICLCQSILPVSRSSAMKASLASVAGSL